MINKPKGTYDILPNESGKWQKIEDIMRRVCKKYNFKEIRTPIFESSEVFHRNQDDTSDMVTKETYDFTDRGGRVSTLRPEGTAGAVRAYIENKLYVDNPILKAYYMGPMFRYERPQKGRYREFNQFGIEAYGSHSPLMDAEVIACACSVIKNLGLKGIKVKINSIGDEESRQKYKEVLVDYFSSYKTDLCVDCLNRLEKNPLRILDCKVDKNKEFFKEAPSIYNYLNESSINHFKKVLDYLDAMGIAYEIDYNLVRGLDYYTHTVFEIEVDVKSFGAQNVICAGGRYDNLIKELGGPDLPAVGLAFGMERLLMAIEFEGRVICNEDYLHLFIIALGDRAQKEALKQLNVCRAGGLICDMDFNGKSLKNQFKTADKYNSRFTAILGDTELDSYQINIKDNETDEQVTIGLNELYPYIVKKITNNYNSQCETCKEKKE